MITCSNIGFGNQLGAQMTNFADLYFIARENNQSIFLLDDFRKYRRGYQFVEVFDFPKEMIEEPSNNRWKTLYNNHFNASSSSWKKNYKKIYKNSIQSVADGLYYRVCMYGHKNLSSIQGLESGVTCDSRLLELDRNKSYDIKDGFGTIREWGKYRSEILKIFKFKETTVKDGNQIWEENVLKNFDNVKKQTCSIHFRRTDYLLISSLNLSDNYYESAIRQFDKDNTLFVVFSDDIDSVKDLKYLQGLNLVFMERNPAIMDMYLMSKCDNNIIANSTFSFWGAYLGDDLNRKVVCPHDFIGDSAPEVQYMNGNWYPDNWIALNIR